MKKTAKTDTSEAKIVIYSRIDPDTVAALDNIRGGMRPKPSRAQLIDTAVAEYVEKHAGRRAKGA